MRNIVLVWCWPSVAVVSLVVMMCQPVLACTNTTHSRTPASCPTPASQATLPHPGPYMQIGVASDNSLCL